MRTIEFRGKRLKDGKWIYGNLADYSINVLDITIKKTVIFENIVSFATDNFGFVVDDCAVDPETVGQFTGLLDKNCKEIYEGDIIHLNDEEFELEHGNGIVVFLDKDYGGRPCGGLWYVEDADEDNNTNTSLYDLYQCGDLEIIGNRFDNPDLLNGK